MGCDDKCGCAVPCPGGADCRHATRPAPRLMNSYLIACPVFISVFLDPCRCTSRTAAGGQREHTTCQCGEHCECTPCTCGRAMMPSGREGRRANCSCGAACGCASCAATTTA
ncbi:hypothetical protein PR202_ga07711 [Eleusine coracana subsp. coracana]|uniref:Metallothionein-like protein n=1 Tax=Eleusine coracana subsp. coracana TaxID=191504 RepID=A0AAV5BY86_ELECO|nr:hypothetical protein PR202_ga07711 [Eleusine coracana subsp. coracana]